ncbi:hypothetical protein AVEN_28136-1 [Araneus ventricosus]|uniref:Uncharacterized protein n=1 Tax=Araneus ventricosus TaxID=182803 RepID=A0A4Y2GI54_ARAVE|nr:hypothetical protein AVEN_28136-1 [Araneus ventricosus]
MTRSGRRFAQGICVLMNNGEVSLDSFIHPGHRTVVLKLVAAGLGTPTVIENAGECFQAGVTEASGLLLTWLPSPVSIQVQANTQSVFLEKPEVTKSGEVAMRVVATACRRERDTIHHFALVLLPQDEAGRAVGSETIADGEKNFSAMGQPEGQVEVRSGLEARNSIFERPSDFVPPRAVDQ